MTEKSLTHKDGTFLAFDYGDKRIGLAVGQTITATARPLPGLKANQGIPDWQKVEAIIKEWQPMAIIVGLPLNMDGTEQDVTARARKFANRVHGRTGVKVHLMDERLSSVAAREELFEQQGYKGLNNQSIDSAAACHILESWFERL